MLDLHVHTRYSADAQGEAEDYIARALELGLSGVSFTEHQNISSSRKGIELAKNAGLYYIVGAEFCAPYRNENFQTDLHILVYGFDIDNVYLGEYLSAVREQERQYLDVLFAGLQKLGVDITKERVLDAIEKNNWPKKDVDSIYIRRLMRQLGYAKDKPESSFLERSAVAKAGYENMSQYPDKEFLFKQMKLAGASCVLAHPCYYTGSRDIIEDIVKEFVSDFGMSGIEVWHPSNPNESRDWLIGIAKRYSLFMTGGSDAHQPGQLGAEGVSESILEYFG